MTKKKRGTHIRIRTKRNNSSSNEIGFVNNLARHRGSGCKMKKRGEGLFVAVLRSKQRRKKKIKTRAVMMSLSWMYRHKRHACEDRTICVMIK